MEKKPNLEVRRTQVAEELRLRVRMKALSRLILDKHFLVDDHVKRLSSERLTAIVDHNGNFAIHPMPFGNEVAFHRKRIDVLAISKAQRAMDVAERIDDRSGDCSVEKVMSALFHSYTMIQSGALATTIVLRVESNERTAF